MEKQTKNTANSAAVKLLGPAHTTGVDVVLLSAQRLRIGNPARKNSARPGPILPISLLLVASRHPVSTPRTWTCPWGPRYASLLAPRTRKNWLQAPPPQECEQALDLLSRRAIAAWHAQSAGGAL